MERDDRRRQKTCFSLPSLASTKAPSPKSRPERSHHHRTLYAESGVRELWTVDPAAVIERWSGDALRQCEPAHDLLRSPHLPGFELHLPALFA